MARRQTLLELLRQYRAEIRASGNPAHNANVRDAQINTLQRVQEWLWEEHDWAFLRVERFVDLQNGQRFYDPPADMPLERIEEIHVRYNGDWVPLTFGIESCNFSLYDSYLDQRSWPAERWRIHEDEQIEIWPVPSEDAERVTSPTSDGIEGRLRFTGIRNLSPLVADTDRADLDDRLITLFAAAETLAAHNASDASAKAEMANKRFSALKGNMSKIKSFRMFGQGTPKRRGARMPTIHYRDKQT